MERPEADGKLRKPVFDSLGNFVYFESNDGFWKYDLKNNKLSVIKGSENQKTSLITDNTQQTFNSEYHIYSRSLGCDNYLIEMKDESNRTSFLVCHGSKSNISISGISNSVNSIIAIRYIEGFIHHQKFVSVRVGVNKLIRRF